MNRNLVISAFAIFAILVNLFPSVAYAAGRVPFIAELAEFVAGSPSLKAAVDNQYVQPVEQKKTVNGVTARIEYVIVDQKQLNVFYTLDSDSYSAMYASPKIEDTEGEPFQGYSISSGGMSNKDNGMRKLTIDFTDFDVPSELVLILDIYEDGISYEPILDTDENMLSSIEEVKPMVSNIIFTLNISPRYTAQGEKLNLNTLLDIDGQKLILESAEIYPIHMRFTFDDFEDNTAWLKSLKFYVENERGERFENISNGISATGKANSPMMATHRLESSFFSESKHLTLCITEATWLSKDMERIHVDLANCTADTLPDGFTLDCTEKYEEGWIVHFSAPQHKEGHYHDLFNSYFNKNGKEYYFNHSTTSASAEGRLEVTLSLSGYTKNEVWLRPAFSHVKALDEPITTKIK